MPTRAAVFDMDGTLVDNMHLHADAWLTTAAALGLTGLTRETFELHYAGKKNEEIVPDLLKRAVAPEEVRRIGDEKEALYRRLAGASLREVQGLSRLLHRLKAAGVQCAIASAAPAENRALVLDTLQLEAHFPIIVGAEHVVRGKPFPDLFLEAARQLSVDAAACIAFEDAVAGVKAAVAAGMRCAAVTTTTSEQALRAAGAFSTFAHYAALPDDVEQALFA